MPNDEREKLVRAEISAYNAVLAAQAAVNRAKVALDEARERSNEATRALVRYDAEREMAK